MQTKLRKSEANVPDQDNIYQLSLLKGTKPNAYNNSSEKLVQSLQGKAAYQHSLTHKDEVFVASKMFLMVPCHS